MGVQAWLKSISHNDPPPRSTFKLLTDSQVTLQSIQKAIKQPTSTWLSTHEPLLQDIVCNLKSLTREGHHVHLGKVKAHSGVRGNIQADLAAKSVVIQKIIDAEGNLNAFTEEELGNAGIDDSCNISNNAHEHHEWPVYPIPEQEGVDEKALQEWEELLKEGTWPDGMTPEHRENMQMLGRDQMGSQTGPSSDSPPDEKWQARNLTASLSRALKRSCRLGYSNDNSLYAKLWREVNPMLLPSVSHLFWDHFTRSSKKVKTCTVRNTIKLRHGTFWNAKLAKRFCKPYIGASISDGMCPLCGAPDSGTHVLGACTHKLLKGLYIERHNEAVATVGKAIMEGARGGCLAVLMADAGWHGKVTGLSDESRIPRQVLPDVPEAELRRMRPDIMLFEKSSEDDLPLSVQDLQHAQHRRRCKVHVIEVGFCTEISYFQKFKEKCEQHSLLLEHLRNAGYDDVQLHPLIFGSTGGMFRLTASHLMHVGVARSRVETLLQEMHWKTLQRLEQIVGTRRKEEHKGNHGEQGMRIRNAKRKRGT